MNLFKKICLISISLLPISISYSFDSIYRFDTNDFLISEVEITYEQAERVAKAAFLLEKYLSTSNSSFAREQLISVLEDFAKQEKYASNPLLIVLKWIINYTNEWVILNYSETSKEYVWWLPVSGTLKIENVRDMLDCEDQAAAWFDCSYRDVIMLDNLDVIHEDLEYLNDQANRWIPMLSDKESLGCYLNNEVVWVYRRTTREGYAQTSKAISTQDLHVEQTYMFQILPLNEMAYGSHGPWPYACQSIARNREEIDVKVDLKSILIDD